MNSKYVFEYLNNVILTLSLGDRDSTNGQINATKI